MAPPRVHRDSATSWSRAPAIPASSNSFSRRTATRPPRPSGRHSILIGVASRVKHKSHLAPGESTNIGRDRMWQRGKPGPQWIAAKDSALGHSGAAPSSCLAGGRLLTHAHGAVRNQRERPDGHAALLEWVDVRGRLGALPASRGRGFLLRRCSRWRGLGCCRLLWRKGLLWRRSTQRHVRSGWLGTGSGPTGAPLSLCRCVS
jgi:hypothetical protein